MSDFEKWCTEFSNAGKGATYYASTAEAWKYQQLKIDALEKQLKEANFVINSLYNVDAMQIDKDEYDYKLESQEVVRVTGSYINKYLKEGEG